MSSPVLRDGVTAGIAAFFAFVLLIAGSSLPLGSAVRMGPGYVPMLLGIALVGVAVLIAGRAVFAWRQRPPHQAQPLGFAWKSLLSIAAGVLAFALLIQPLGLIASAVVAVVLTSLAQAAASLKERFLLAGFLAAFSSLLFPIALELPVPVLPHLF